MLAIFYLMISFLLGHITISLTFPKLKAFARKTYKGRDLGIPSEFLLYPSYFITGIVLLTWTTYIIAYLARNTSEPLAVANSLALTFYSLICMLFYARSFFKSRGGRKLLSKNRFKKPDFTKGELVYLFLTTMLSIFLMCYTFYIIANKLHVGFTVFSDFTPHLSMIRSFSKGNNFPTSYTFYAGEDIRYHFMFLFLAGNLEFLGMRLDFAFNIPSAMGLISVYLLLYVLAVKISERRSVGFLTGLLFTFRSSISFFTYLAQIPSGESRLATLARNTEYIGFTPKENWGLWNLNVYANQRHLPLSIAMLLFIIILFLPKLYKMFSYIQHINNIVGIEEFTRKSYNKLEKIILFRKKTSVYIKTIFFTKQAWIIKNYKLAIFAGILAGATAFWNGAGLIALISILFLMAIFSSNRLEYLITALIATGLSILQSAFFVDASPVSAEFKFGFIVENPNLFSVVEYIIRLLGFLPFVILFAFIIKKGVERYLILAFLGPAIITFCISLTPDVTVNHKYLMISVMLLGIIAANLLVDIFKKRKIIYKTVAIFLVIFLTITGFYDFTTLIKINKNSVILELDNDITKWIEENTDSQDIFLTSTYSLNQVVFAGAPLYHGWPYFAWSAGYDTAYRDEQVKLMYEADSSEELEELVKKNNISYIIVDRENRITESYNMNEENIKNTYECVYEEAKDEYKFSIYDTSYQIYK